ncbi:hypothetical protein EMN47_09960 [Prolixibacteraceae bacterium JC049]|nr:hypothetical protein [Prolixibacteraceae bacterium JC049]
MSNILKMTLFICILALASCKVHYPSMQSLRAVNYPNHSMNDTLSVAYVKNIWKVAQMPEKYTKWADRKKFRFIGVRLTNTSSKTIRGYQLKFYDEDGILKLLDNKWVGKKVFRQHSPIPVIGSVLGAITGGLILNRLGMDDENHAADFAMKKHELQEDVHSNLVYELMTFDINEKILFPGEPVYGVIVAKKKTVIKELKVKVVDTETESYW